MKELRKKTFWTILILLSLILLSTMILLNVRSYSRESEGIRRNLGILDDRGGFRRDAGEPAPGPPDGKMMDRDKLKNMMIMNYELYTVQLQNGEISEILSHGNESDDFDAEAAAREIIAGESSDSIKVGNLYSRDYSYRYRYMDSIVILNNKEVKNKLWELLGQSLLIFILLELVIIVASGKITKWITEPAESAFARQKEFIADASHELKTPLAVIMASADEIKEKDENRKYIENIRYESDRMNRLITGLLNLSRLEDGEDTAGYKDEDLSRILNKTCLVYEGVAYEQGVTIQTDIEEGLHLKCSREEIEQMTATLLDNAVRHSYPDTAVRVIAGSVKGKNSISIRVINSGDPIPKEDREKIFERFYRGDKARGRDDNRYGLGLAIARRIANNHNGDIRADSENGDTVFLVTLKTSQ
ncbi:MAG: HAMP domain-containing histidine kinase [Lachnospiraceae bacterium]|nr:HAMP domain-containing histidine kinase [Lachnospiraceae bacterium]